MAKGGEQFYNNIIIWKLCISVIMYLINHVIAEAVITGLLIPSVTNSTPAEVLTH
jgi:hypothetical protein